MINKCDCYDKTLREITERYKRKLGDHSGLVSRWGNKAWIPGSRDHSPVNPQIHFSYNRLKKDGTPHARLTTDSLSVLGDYCTFCANDARIFV